MSEAQLLWPSDKNTFSHLLLSVGSGWIEDADDSQNDSNGDSIIEIGRKKVNQVAEFFRFRSSQLQRRLDRNRVSEKTWNEAFCQISRKHPTRCVRLNPKLSGAQLQGTAADISTEFLAQDNTRLQISNVCHALLATTFYFNATENSCLSEYGRVTMTGKIFCRFPNGSDTIRSLSRVLERLRNPCIDLTSPVIKSWDINKTIISRMKRDGILDMPVDFQVPGQ
ncbi:uncharacterized protein FTOL_12132 [Fusarium torulosum]|uniref:Uncharacterized protein n=1 Tax=Fusarium torulosum TaxID=33205 RepID=A0AAE8MLG1_9HYPO|nr:uncharacterized protein FTOL_12132 [Fusarium torulosum]